MSSPRQKLTVAHLAAVRAAFLYHVAKDAMRGGG